MTFGFAGAAICQASNKHRTIEQTFGATEKTLHARIGAAKRSFRHPSQPGCELLVDRPLVCSGEQKQPADESPKYEMSSSNISGLLKGRFELDVLIEPGDIINIPATDVFFVSGEVKAPGSFPLKEGTTLRQAVSLAQGTIFKSAADKTIIFRENADGKRESIKVELSAVMNGKKPDVLIMANDIIMVPSSRAKSIGGALLNAFGMTSVTRIPIY